MKHTFFWISLLFCIAMQTKAQVSVAHQQSELTMAQVLTKKEIADETSAKSKFHTIETATQSHDGTPVYKTVREVEYTFKETAQKITRKRKVLSSTTERLSSESQWEEIYPDMTTTLLSSVFSPKNIKKTEEAVKMPFRITVNQTPGTTQVLFDKLALMQSLGKKMTDSVMGTQISYEVITEQLEYGSLSEQLYIDQLEGVQTVVALTTTDKSGSSHRVEVKEDIQVR